MKIKILVLIFSAFWIPYSSIAATVYLKNGGKIIANEVHRNGGKVICSKDGIKVFLDEESVRKIDFQGNEINERMDKKKSFTFDVWQSGMDIDEILRLAEKNDIPLLKEGLVSIIKNFNPDVSTKYANTATQYHYKTELLGNPAIVNLYLTPTSKRMHSLSVRWGIYGDSRRVDLENEIKDLICSKYGKPKKHLKPILGKLTIWQPSPFIEIEFKQTTGNLIILYKDKEMIQVAKNETDQTKLEKKTEYLSTDAKKF